MLHWNFGLLSDERIGWLYKQGIQQNQQEFPESNNIGFECKNVKKNITSQEAGEILEKIKHLNKGKY